MNNIVFIKYKKGFCLALMIGLFLLINGIAISLTQVWNADHIIALLLGNILLIAAYFYFVGIYKLSKKLFDSKNKNETTDKSVSNKILSNKLLGSSFVNFYLAVSFYDSCA